MSLVVMMADMVLDSPCVSSAKQVYWFCDNLSFAALIPSFFGRFPLVQSIIWDKDLLGVGAHYRKQTEFIIYGRTPNAPAMRTDARDLIRLRPNHSEKEHPAAKPLALIVELIGATDFGLVLDPFMGSGTTLRAAKDLGRKAVGIEIEERYCEIAAKRMEQSRLKKPRGQADSEDEEEW